MAGIASVLTRGRIIALVVVVLAVASIAAAFEPGTKHGVAYFSSVTSVYPKDKIRILGVEVGKIDKITPEDGRVRVDFSYDSKYDLPADVKAAVVSPTLVATRFIQLAPAYDGGPRFPDNGVIPETRTASPLEFDDLKTELSRISTTLGPNGADSKGALSDFLSVVARNGKGKGAEFNTMVTELSKALSTLANGRGDMFGTVRNLQVFVSALASIDGPIATFNHRLAGVSGLLAANGKDLTAAIASVDRAARLVRGFVQENRPGMAAATKKLGDLTTTLAASRDNIATLLHVGPNTLTNFFNIFSPRMQAMTGGLMVDELSTPGSLLCTLASQATSTNDSPLSACMKYIAPLFDKLGISSPPIGTTGPLQIPGGGGPYPNGTNETPPAGGNVMPGGSSPSGTSGLGGLGGLLLPGGGQ